MRWDNLLYNVGDERERTFFAWFPVTCYHYEDGFRETRWLERVTIRERLDLTKGGTFWTCLRFL